MTLAEVFATTVAAFPVLICARRRRCWAFRVALPFLLDRYFRRAFHSDHCRASSVHSVLQ